MNRASVADVALRTVPAFSLSAAIAYFFFMGAGISPFVYYPQVGRLFWVTQDNIGPPMFWYSWLALATITGLAVAAFAAILPARVSKALYGRGSWFLWGAPLLIAGAILFFLKHYFIS